MKNVMEIINTPGYDPQSVKEATMISMTLGFTTLALFVDGLLRLLGIIPPFMDINISIIDEIMQRLSL